MQSEGISITSLEALVTSQKRITQHIALIGKSPSHRSVKLQTQNGFVLSESATMASGTCSIPSFLHGDILHHEPLHLMHESNSHPQMLSLIPAALMIKTALSWHGADFASLVIQQCFGPSRWKSWIVEKEKEKEKGETFQVPAGRECCIGWENTGRKR